MIFSENIRMFEVKFQQPLLPAKPIFGAKVQIRKAKNIAKAAFSQKSKVLFGLPSLRYLWKFFNRILNFKKYPDLRPNFCENSPDFTLISTTVAQLVKVLSKRIELFTGFFPSEGFPKFISRRGKFTLTNCATVVEMMIFSENFRFFEVKFQQPLLPAKPIFGAKSEIRKAKNIAKPAFSPKSKVLFRPTVSPIPMKFF